MTRYYIQAPQPSVHGGKIKMKVKNPFKGSSRAIADLAEKGVKESKKYGKIGFEEGKKYGKIGLKEGKKYGEIGWEASKPVLEDIGKYTQKKVVPGLVTIGTPIASAAVGAATTYATGNPFAGAAAAQATQMGLKAGIPQKYQSRNPYINMAGDLAGAMAQQEFAGAMDLGDMPEMNPYQTAFLQTMGNMQVPQAQYGRPSRGNQYSTPTSQYYMPENPYNDIIRQHMNNYPKNAIKFDKIPKPRLNLRGDRQAEEPTPMAEPEPMKEPIDLNAKNNAMYKSNIDDNNEDTIKITNSPYEQKEGSSDALLGAGLKKKKRGSHSAAEPSSASTRKRGRPKKIIVEETEIYIKKKPSYKKFSHAKNASLDQLLEATSEREDKEAKKAMKEMVAKQTAQLTALGFGLNRKIKRRSL